MEAKVGDYESGFPQEQSQTRNRHIEVRETAPTKSRPSTEIPPDYVADTESHFDNDLISASSTKMAHPDQLEMTAASQMTRVSRIFAQNGPWQRRSEIKVRIDHLPQSVDTRAVWQNFHLYGNIDTIELVASGNIGQQLCAYVVFKPAPTNAFWLNRSISFTWNSQHSVVTAKLINSKYLTFYEVPSSKSTYPDMLELSGKRIDFGILHTPKSMKSFHTTSENPSLPVTLRLDLSRSKIEIEFPQKVEIDHTNVSGESHKWWQYRFIIPINSKFKIFKAGQSDINGQQSGELIISLDSPPEFSRKYAPGNSHEAGKLSWKSSLDPWCRVVDFSEHDNQNSSHQQPRPPQPASLCGRSFQYKLGRWTTYKLTFAGDLKSHKAMQVFSALRDFNINVQEVNDFSMVTSELTSVFDLLVEHAIFDQYKGSDFIGNLHDYGKVVLDFQVRYQLEVCISEGYLNEYQLDHQFLDKLKEMNPAKARGLLIGVAADKQRVFDPMTIFESTAIKPDRLQLPNYCFYARSITVTPTTIYIATPSLDVSNRVIRRYREHTDRFLRVRFTEERPSGKVRTVRGEHMNRVYTRIQDVLQNGIIIGDRHYVFLAFGNSQLREHSAYFFCPTGHLTPEIIRAWMGNFHDKVVAKYSARLGQCFSTTRAVVGAHIRLGKLEDVKTKDGKYNFTDGVGVITEFMAKIAANELGVLRGDGQCPSALQFRLGGCKGVLAVWPSKPRERSDIWVRRSQEKFRAEYQGLEIIRWSHYSSAYLNRQLITILTTLGVTDNVFIHKMKEQLADLDEAMINPAVSAKLLQRDVDPNQMSLEVAAIVNNHFQVVDEPFLISVLQLWKAYTIKFLKEKARILIHKGANLLGVVDELGVLKGHFDKFKDERIQHRIDALPQIFVQVTDFDGEKGGDKPKVIEGVVILARNPSLHPGDIRVVRAVDVPSLHHLKDVVVLPQRGDRDLASMCSGGDLDGDDYVVIWDENLIPREWNHEPMDFTPPAPNENKGAITVRDITNFFVQYIQNDTLPVIANAHLAWADQSSSGAKDPKCLELANLHSIAVDFPKSGHHAEMRQGLKVKSWPHFMEKRERTHHSESALGKLYDMVQKIDYTPDYGKPFDSRVLQACKADDAMLHKVASIKAEYDEGIRRIMAQHDIQWELEVWSTFVLKHNRVSNDYKFHEEIGHLSSSLKEAIRTKCYEAAGGRDHQLLAPFVAAMYMITHQQVQHALNKIVETPIPSGTPMPFISFPWIFSAILGDIATGRLITSTEGVAIQITRELESKQKEKSKAEAQVTKKSARVVEAGDIVDSKGETTHKGELLALFDESGQDENNLVKGKDVLALSNGGSNPSGSSSECSLAQDRDLIKGIHLNEEGKDVGCDSESMEFGVERSIGVSTSLLDRLARMNIE